MNPQVLRQYTLSPRSPCVSLIGPSGSKYANRDTILPAVCVCVSWSLLWFTWFMWLAHPIPGAPVSLAVDTFDYALGAVLQQRVNDAWQPLGFLTKPLNSAQRKYTAVKRFRRAIEKRYFIIFTDHKPLHMRSIKTSISVRRDNSDTSITSDNSPPTYDT